MISGRRIPSVRRGIRRRGGDGTGLAARGRRGGRARRRPRRRRGAGATVADAGPRPRDGRRLGARLPLGGGADRTPPGRGAGREGRQGRGVGTLLGAALFGAVVLNLAFLGY